MARASPIQNSFNAGEFSPLAQGRTDVAKYGAACKVLEGFIPLIQGPAQRRGGIRYVAELKDSSKRAWLVRQQVSSTTSFMLEFGEGYIRFFQNHAPVLDTFTLLPYEVATPYTASDLTDSEGNFALRFAASADVIYIACATQAPRKLSRVGAVTWTLATVATAGGPFKAENITATTVYSSAVNGVVTLTASTPIFSAQNVGSLFYLAQKSVNDVKAWEAGKAVGAADLRRSGGKNYYAINAATTGGDKPTHTQGAVYDGDSGVQWLYVDVGFGNVLITGYTDPQNVTGLVVSPFPSNPTSQLPGGCVGAPNASTRWAFAAWSNIEGWPTQVAFFRGRLCFARQQTVWLSVAGDLETFTAVSNDSLITADMAITENLQSTQINDVKWMMPNYGASSALVCGTAGSVFAVKSMTENQPYGTDNHTAEQISTLGTRNTDPVQSGNVVLFVSRGGSRLRDVDYDFYSNRFVSVDQSILAEHIAAPGLVQLCFQQDPNSLIWGAGADGSLACMTYSREQYPDAPHGGWHRHPVAGSVESVAVIPAPDNTRDELWIIARLTVNGAARRYVGYMDRERQPSDDPEDQFYVDFGKTLTNTIAATLTPGAEAVTAGAENVFFVAGSAVFAATDIGRSIVLRYQDADGFASGKARITSYVDPQTVYCTIDSAWPSAASVASGGWRLTVTTLTGLSYLEGRTVDVLADGGSHPQAVVTAGSITLQRPATKVHVGLPAPAHLQTLRLNAGAQDGTSQGKRSRVNQCVVRLLETGSLRYGANFTEMYDVDFRTPQMAMDRPPDIFSGDVLLDWPGEYDTNPWLCFSVDQPMAATLVALMPQVFAQDKG